LPAKPTVQGRQTGALPDLGRAPGASLSDSLASRGRLLARRSSNPFRVPMIASAKAGSPCGGFGTDSPPCPPRALRARPRRPPEPERPLRGLGPTHPAPPPRALRARPSREGLARPSEASGEEAAGGGPKGEANPFRVPISKSGVVEEIGGHHEQRQHHP
jgi:hypothetical protein